jgi:hypothetical protein
VGGTQLIEVELIVGVALSGIIDRCCVGCGFGEFRIINKQLRDSFIAMIKEA